MIVVGLTGGLASGKTTVAGMFNSLGAKVLDADRIAHRALYKTESPYKRVLKKFGRNILNRNNSINRKKLGKVVFESKRKQQELCSIIHPWVFERIDEKLRNFKKNKAIKVVVIEAVLLIESGFHKKTDMIIIIKSTGKQQIERAMLRGMKPAQAKKRMSFQLKYQDKTKFADYIIDNCSTLKYTKKQVNRIWKIISAKEENFKNRFLKQRGFL